MKLAVSLFLTIAAALPLLAENPVAELRQTSKAILGTIPDKMPGSETDTPAMVELGRTLFFDVRLSANNTQSCNSCHAIDQQRGGADTMPTSLGDAGKHGGRNAPTVLNAGFHVAQFWDGRAADLAAQAKGPILNPVEMGMHGETAVLDKLNAVPGYDEAFAKAFPKDAKPLNYDNLARAIAAFEHTLITHDRFDDFLKGEDGALNERERKGLQTFVSVGCIGCHNGPLFGGNSFQKVGVVNAYKTDDVGRYAITKDEADKFKFKVPSLRNVEITGPYFHDGSQATLEGTVREMAWIQLGRKLTDQEVDDIVTFLHTLTDKSRTPAHTTSR